MRAPSFVAVTVALTSMGCRRTSHAMALSLATLMLAGCGETDEMAGTLSPQQAADHLESAFQTTDPETSTTDPIQIGVRSASEALRTGDYEKAVVSLEVTRTGPESLTLDQGMAVHQSYITLEQHLINAVAAGDPNAQRAYDLLRQSKRN